MGHNITAIILKGEFDTSLTKEFDLIDISLGFGLTLFHIDSFYSECWQHLLKTEGELETYNIDNISFPKDAALAEIMRRISNRNDPEYAIIMTDYFAGIGSQWANVFKYLANADNKILTINQALRYLGVTAKNGLDEFDTIGLDKIRVQPEYLEKYQYLFEELGLF